MAVCLVRSGRMRCAEGTGSLEDIKCRRIHVAGRDWHFVFGVTGHEGVVKGQFAFEKINRTDFFMYYSEYTNLSPLVTRHVLSPLVLY